MVRQLRTGARAPMTVIVMVMALAGAGVLAGCGDGPNPFQAASSTTVAAGSVGPGATTEVTTDGTSTDGAGENEFIPDRDLSDCVGALERPNCGSAEKGGLGTYLVFLALILGVGFIMWRIARGVKARDAVMNAPAPATDPAALSTPSDATTAPQPDAPGTATGSD